MRITSIALVPLAVAFVIIVLTLVGKDYAGVRSVLGQPLVALLMLLFILSGVYHMKLGMQAIIDDYVHAPALKPTILRANLGFAVIIGLACIAATLKLSFT